MNQLPMLILTISSFCSKKICKQLNTIETQYFNVETQMGKTTMFVCIYNVGLQQLAPTDFECTHTLLDQHQLVLKEQPSFINWSAPTELEDTNLLFNWSAPIDPEGTNLLFNMSAPTDRETTTSLANTNLPKLHPSSLLCLMESDLWKLWLYSSLSSILGHG